MRPTLVSIVLGAVLVGLCGCGTDGPATPITTASLPAAAAAAPSSTTANGTADIAVACTRMDPVLRESYLQWVEASDTISDVSAGAAELRAAASTMRQMYVTTSSQARTASTETANARLKSALIAYANANDAAARQVEAAGSDRGALEATVNPDGYNEIQGVVIGSCRGFLHPA